MGNFDYEKLTILKNIIGIVFGFLLFVGFVYAQNNHWLGRVEGYFFPVVLTTTFNASQRESDLSDIDRNDFVVINGTMNKYRSCLIDRIEAEIIDSSNNITTKLIYFEVEPKNHPIGNNWSWGPWIIRVPYSEIITQNKIIALYTYHHCHPFWETVTRFR